MTFPLPWPTVTDFSSNKVSAVAVQENFEALAGAVIGTGGSQPEVRYGTSTCTWTASNTSAQQTVVHGMGKAPVTVIVSSRNLFASYAVNGGNITSTGFGVFGFDTRGTAQTQTLTFDWVAIG